MSNFFPKIELSETEEAIVAQSLSHPTVKKYFQSLAQPLLAAVSHGLPAHGEDDTVYLRRVAVVKGNLETLNSLLSIQAALPVAQQSQ